MDKHDLQRIEERIKREVADGRVPVVYADEWPAIAAVLEIHRAKYLPLMEAMKTLPGSFDPNYLAMRRGRLDGVGPDKVREILEVAGLFCDYDVLPKSQQHYYLRLSKDKLPQVDAPEEFPDGPG